MEDVLSVYSRPYDAKRPVICMDEKPYQLLDEEYETIEMSGTNHTRKYDCEYTRKGTCSIFMFTEPLGLVERSPCFASKACRRLGKSNEMAY
jgi:hypothetical protein